MLNRKQIREEKVTLSEIKSLIATYQEIAAIRMQKVKTSVLKNRDYVGELQKIYNKILHNYSIHLKKNSDNTSLNGKTLAVLLSSNTGLYGDIVQKVLKDYVTYLSENKCDAAVIGSVGYAFVKYNFPDKDVKYFQLGDGVLDSPQIDDLCNYIFEYEKSTLFFGKFYSVLNQSSDKIDLNLHVTADETATPEPMNFIFEPSVDGVMSFFKSEILSTMVEQTISESGLSKFASRMISLDKAVSGINTRIKAILLKEFVAKHSVMNKKQSSMFSSFSLWK